MALVSANAEECELTIDDDGWRTYTVTYKVFTDAATDGPATVLATLDTPRGPVVLSSQPGSPA